MTIKSAAQRYIDLGWSVTPLEPKDKACIHKDWRTRVYTVADFNETNNIGLKLINGLVDIDCDCAEAVFMAAAFLPKTTAVYGRASRPNAHWLFTCPEITQAFAFKDLVQKKMIAEIRVNHQSMAPPSIHPDGETVLWTYDVGFTAMPVEKNLLIRAVRLLTTGAFVARHYNPPGARHEWGMALAGVFRRLGLTVLEAELVLSKAAAYVKDLKVKDRIDAVKSTYATADDDQTTGGKKLTELTNAEFVATIYKIWGGESTGGVSQTKLDAMNKTHAVVHLQSGNVIILSEERENDQLQIRYSTRADFNLLYPNPVQVGMSAAGKPIMKPLAEAWIGHPKRRFYRGIELAPGGKVNEGYYNLWQGFSVEPKKGDWSLFRQHLSLLVDGNEDHAYYVLNWMADTVQRPHLPIGIALAFKGGQGVGKSTFAKWFGRLFGAHFMHLDSEHRLLGQFNSHLHNTIVLFADEAVWAGGKQGLGALKRMITEETLAIEAKHVNTINVKNMIHMIVASNEEWFVPANFDDRRFAIFAASAARQNQYQFFGAVADQLLKNGGLAALLYDLLEFKLDLNLREIPNTDERETQKHRSMTPQQAWWFEQLQSGEPWVGATELPPDGEGGCSVEIDPDVLYAAYVTSLNKADHRMNAGFMGYVGRFMRTMLPEGYPLIHQHGGKRYWVLPSLVRSRAAFDAVTRLSNKWPKDPVSTFGGDVPF